VSTGFFSIGEDGKLKDVSEVAFEKEDTLQELVAKFPRLLSGDEGSSAEPSQWLFVAREMGIPSEENQPNRWSVDHLFLDRSGVPTLVEVKRSEDTRIRREVVGQMLDYAANASIFWPMETIRNSFSETCEANKPDALDPNAVLSDFLGPDVDPEIFWGMVETNLQASRLRLVFLADQLPIELRRIIEFLNKQMDRTEVIGVEIKQYGGEGFKALTSRTVGRTADTVKRKTEAGRRWDEGTFFKAIAEQGKSGDEVLARRLFDWSKDRELRTWWGKGRLFGSFYPVLDLHGTEYQLYAVWTDSQIEMPFGTLRNRAQFATEERRREFLDRLNEIPSVHIEESRISGYPKIPFSALRTDGDIDTFLEVIDWAIGVIEADDE